MIGRIDQQLLVTRLMLGYYHSAKITSYKLRHYMVRYLEIMMTICSILAIKSGTDENMEKKKQIWEDLREQDLGSVYAPALGLFGTEHESSWQRAAAPYPLPATRSARSSLDLTSFENLELTMVLK